MDRITIHVEGADKVAEILAQLELADLPTDEALGKAASAFARWASVKSNPNAGSKKMATDQEMFEKIFFRPVLWLPKLVRGELRGFHSSQEDIDQLRLGMKWKVVKTRGRHFETMGYFKDRAEAEKAASIHTRGMLRAMWGLNIDQAGGKVPKEIVDILRENPDLIQWSDFNEAHITKDERGKYLELINGAPESYRYKDYIKQAALPYSWKTLIRSSDEDTQKLIKQLQRTLERNRR